MSLRTLKHHESKLLKKVDFLQWSGDQTVREGTIINRFHLKGPDEYAQYQKVINNISSLCNKLKGLEPNDPYRLQMSEQLTQKLYVMGVISDNKSLLQASKVSVSAICKRRIPLVLIKLKMAQSMKDAVRYVEHGHIRIGPNVITDPAFLITRPMEDFLTWTDSSKIKRLVLAHNDQLDDYDNPEQLSTTGQRNKTAKGNKKEQKRKRKF